MASPPDQLSDKQKVDEKAPSCADLEATKPPSNKSLRSDKPASGKNEIVMKNESFAKINKSMDGRPESKLISEAQSRKSPLGRQQVPPIEPPARESKLSNKDLDNVTKVADGHKSLEKIDNNKTLSSIENTA